MIDISILPHFQALMNSTTVCLMLIAFYFIKQDKEKNKKKHMWFMLSALFTSMLFLISYTIHHKYAGLTKFSEDGLVRYFYLTLLLVHTVVSFVLLPMVLLILYRAFKGDFKRHGKLAKWTLPTWLFVSASGVIIYTMLYHLYPPSG